MLLESSDLQTVLRPLDDHVLQGPRQLNERGDIACHPHHQIGIAGGIFLCRTQGIGRDDVELDLVNVQIPRRPMCLISGLLV